MTQQDRRATVVATLAAPLPETAEERASLLAGVRRHAEVLEVRADLVGDPDPAELRRLFDGELLYTLRSADEGGHWQGSLDRRHHRMAAAAREYHFVDLEAARDLDPALLERVPERQRVLSWHGPGEDLVELEERFAGLATTPARLYKMVVLGRTPGDAVGPLLLAAALKRDDLLAFAAGRTGSWTRLLAPRYGAAVVYGAASPAAAGAPGQLTVAELAADYGLPALPPVERLYGILGDPVVSTSLSPRLHNGAYRELGIPALYVPFETASVGDFWLDVVESDLFRRLRLPLAGLSVTAPHKGAAVAVAGALSPLAEHVNVVNTLIAAEEGVWEGECTDPAGVVDGLARYGVTPEARSVAVVGAGGAGRSVAFALAHAGAEVTVANRGAERGRQVAEELELPYVPLAELQPREFDILVHATPLGKHDGDPLPFAVDGLGPGTAVVDMVYRRQPTPLVAAARQRGCIAVDGREVLLYQALDQFRLMTGRELPEELGRRLLDLAAAPPPAATSADTPDPTDDTEDRSP